MPHRSMSFWLQRISEVSVVEAPTAERAKDSWKVRKCIALITSHCSLHPLTQTQNIIGKFPLKTERLTGCSAFWVWEHLFRQRWQQQLSNFSWPLTTLTTSIQNLPTTPTTPDDPWRPRRPLTTPTTPATPDNPDDPDNPWRTLTTPWPPCTTATGDLCPFWRPCLWPLFVCWTYWFVGWMGGKFQQFTPHILLSVLLCEVEGVKSC